MPDVNAYYSLLFKIFKNISRLKKDRKFEINVYFIYVHNDYAKHYKYKNMISE